MAEKETAGLSTLGSVCACAHICEAALHGDALFLKQQERRGHEELVRLQDNVARQLNILGFHD